MVEGKNLQTPDAPQKAANQKNLMSENDPKDGNRTSFTLEDEQSAADRKPEQDRQDQQTIEEFGQRGIATTDKEA